MQTATQSELSDIAIERGALLEGFRSGDFTTQRHALERLSILAENYFPKFLAQSVALTSDANRLDDRIRKRTISVDDQAVEIRNLVQRGVELLGHYDGEPPISRISSESKTANSPQMSLPRSRSTVASLYSDTPAGATTIQNVVQRPKRELSSKLIVTHEIAKTFSQSSFELHPISLELNRGEILGIVGINASGKTTLLRMLIGELTPSRGTLLFPSFESSSARDWLQIKRRIGYVSQIVPTWPGKLYDNLSYSASVFGHPRASIDATLDLILKRYGLDKFREASWKQLSGGYKTRFEIARVLLAKPDIVVLDEPLAYLDIISQQIVLRQLKQLAKNLGNPVGIVVTSQQLYEIEAIADRLLVLDGGNILFSGPVADIAKLIDHTAIEIGTSDSLTLVRQKLTALSNFRTVFATETGLIALFENAERKPRSDTFNAAIRILTSDTSIQMSYARDISRSSRLLFEPQIADSLR